MVVCIPGLSTKFGFTNRQAFRQLAANLDAQVGMSFCQHHMVPLMVSSSHGMQLQVIDQIVDEHNRRQSYLVGSSPVKYDLLHTAP